MEVSVEQIKDKLREDIRSLRGVQKIACFPGDERIREVALAQRLRCEMLLAWIEDKQAEEAA